MQVTLLPVLPGVWYGPHLKGHVHNLTQKHQIWAENIYSGLYYAI